jgi:hypothetical protein
MPWTFAHPAAVLPLRPWCPQRLSFGALVVGSISPDIGYYVGWFDLATAAHTLLGLLTICLPSGLALTALVRVLHRPVAGLLPHRHRQAILSLPPMPLPKSPIAAWTIGISVLIGAVSHVAWDSFTHGTGYLVSKWPALRMPVLVLFTGCITPLVGASHRQAHHLLENISLKMLYSSVYALLCIENAPITV